MKFLTKYLLFFLAVIFNTSSFACSCLPQDLGEKFEDYDKIFSARLNSAIVVSGEEKWGQVEGVFQVVETFKGELEINQKVKLKSNFGVGGCGVPMTVGRKYIILSSEDSINICTGTNTIDMYSDDVLNEYRQLSTLYL